MDNVKEAARERSGTHRKTLLGVGLALVPERGLGDLPVAGPSRSRRRRRQEARHGGSVPGVIDLVARGPPLDPLELHAEAAVLRVDGARGRHARRAEHADADAGAERRRRLGRHVGAAARAGVVAGDERVQQARDVDELGRDRAWLVLDLLLEGLAARLGRDGRLGGVPDLPGAHERVLAPDLLCGAVGDAGRAAALVLRLKVVRPHVDPERRPGPQRQIARVRGEHLEVSHEVHGVHHQVTDQAVGQRLLRGHGRAHGRGPTADRDRVLEQVAAEAWGQVGVG